MLVKICQPLQQGALFVIERSHSLDFIKSSGDKMYIEITQPIIESIFYKNSPLHDGAAVIVNNYIVATRVILPVSNERNIPLHYGLRHRAAVGITEKTDALALVVSEETGAISYLKNGEFVKFKNCTRIIAAIERCINLSRFYTSSVEVKQHPLLETVPHISCCNIHLFEVTHYEFLTLQSYQHPLQ
ncbi:Diadenylate cyclase CdaS [Nymphon striatum]|nr:Diadenylate cyclase CdaS [Nymphon striatum]